MRSLLSRSFFKARAPRSIIRAYMLAADMPREKLYSSGHSRTDRSSSSGIGMSALRAIQRYSESQILSQRHSHTMRQTRSVRKFSSHGLPAAQSARGQGGRPAAHAFPRAFIKELCCSSPKAMRSSSSWMFIPMGPYQAPMLQFVSTPSRIALVPELGVACHVND